MQWKCLKLKIAIACLTFVCLFATPVAFADTSSSKWNSSDEEPTILDGDAITYEEYDKRMRNMRGIYGRRICTEKTFALSGGYMGSPQCYYDTSAGEVSQHGYLFRPKGSQFAGYVNSAQSQLMTTMNPEMYIELVPVDGGMEVHFRDKNAVAVRYIETTPEQGYIPFFEWVNPPTKILLNSDGDPAVIDGNMVYSQIWYSKNGRWMLMWNSDGSVTRVDLKNLKFLTLQAQMPTDEESWYASLDISPDGGQIAVNIYGRPLRLVDAEACSRYESDRITEPKFCSIRFLGTSISQVTGDYYGYGNLPTFIDDTTLEFYSDAREGGDTWIYYMFAPGTKDTGKYIALGDSFASGEGAKEENYFKGTAVYQINECHLSKKSYPYLLSDLTSVNNMRSVACSGARMLNINGNELIDRKLELDNRTNQYLIARPNELGDDWMPGYELQESFISRDKPDISTISIGGNNVGFSNIIQRCVGGGDTCFASYEDRVELIDIVNSKFGSLVELYKRIKQDSLGIKLYVIGYPQVISSNNCGDTHLNAEEARFATHLISYINEVMQLAAKRAGVQYIDTEQAFNGHRICDNTDQPAMNGLRLRLTRHTDRIARAESFHPNEKGHELMSEAIKYQTNNFTKRMPGVDNTFPDPDAMWPVKAHELLGEAPVTNRDIRIVEHADDSAESVAWYNYVKFGIEGALGWIGKRSSAPVAYPIRFDIVINSEPRHLGSISFEANSDKQVSVQIPGDIEPGLHTIHLYAQLSSGEKIDIQKQVFIHSSRSDWNGNGIPNDKEGCSLFDAYPAIPDDPCEYYDYSDNPSNTAPSESIVHKGSGQIPQQNVQNISKKPNNNKITASDVDLRNETKTDDKELQSSNTHKQPNATIQENTPHLRKNQLIFSILIPTGLILMVILLRKLTYAYTHKKT